jgi:geranylgeranyl diphosphate synthase type 3
LGFCDRKEHFNISLNSDQSDILRQQTQDVELKKYCFKLLVEFGSLSYTRRTLEVLDAVARAEIAKLGGNPVLEKVLNELLDWKKDRDDKKPEQ